MKLFLAASVFLTTSLLALRAEAAPASPQPPNEVALFSIHIGVNEAPLNSPLPKLRYADDDAWRMHTFFSATSDHSEWLAIVDTQSRQRLAARSLAPPPPTSAALTRTIARLRKRMQAAARQSKRVELVMTFAGHGVVQEGKVQLALLDGFLSQDFFDDMAAWPEVDRLHLILDACHAGGVFRGRGFRSQGSAQRLSPSTESPTESKQSLTKLHEQSWFTRRPHVGALLSSSANGITHEWSRIEGGLFTHEVLSALRGAADINGDQKITYDEVAAFSALAKSTLINPVSGGTVLSFPPTRSPFTPLAELQKRNEGRLLIPKNRRLWIRHVDGRILMHVYTGAALATVVLPVNTALVVVDENERQAEFELRATEPQSIDTFVFTEGRGERGDTESTQKGWLRRAFTADFFDGWSQSETKQKLRVNEEPSRSTSIATTEQFAAGPAKPQPEDVRKPWMFIGGLGAAAAGSAALMVVSGIWMASSAAAYNQTNFEIPASDAAAAYTIAATGTFLFGIGALAATGGMAALFIWPESYSPKD